MSTAAANVRVFVAAGPAFAKAIRAAADLERTMRRVAAFLDSDLSQHLAELERQAKLTGWAMERSVDRLRVAREKRLVGLCVRYQVRAGLDPDYASPVMRDALVLDLVTGEEWPVRGYTQAERCQVAAAALRGWVEHYAALEPRPCQTRCEAGECGGSPWPGCGGCCRCLGGCQVEWEMSQPRVFQFPRTVPPDPFIW